MHGSSRTRSYIDVAQLTPVLPQSIIVSYGLRQFTTFNCMSHSPATDVDDE